MQPTGEETWGAVVKYSCPSALRERAQTLHNNMAIKSSHLFGSEPLGGFIGTGKAASTVVYLSVHFQQAGRHLKQFTSLQPLLLRF